MSLVIEDDLENQDTSVLQRERKEWSKLISIICYIGFIACIGAVTIIIVLVLVPGIVGFSHKNFIVGILSLFFIGILLLLYKARDDSRSLIFISIFAIALSFLTIGFSAGQFIRHA
jgi:hypothetical protein